MRVAASIAERAAVLAERIARREGCDLVHCEYVNQSGTWLLRVFIDREGGVTIDDCGAVSRQLSAVLDVEDFIPHSYNLEVSSPGLDRSLRDVDDYRRHTGKQVRLKTSAPVKGRREFRGMLAGLEGEVVTIEALNGQSFEIPLERVKSARLEPEI